jgi:hypothetical protein
MQALQGVREPLNAGHNLLRQLEEVRTVYVSFLK